MGLESYPRKGVANEADERILMEKRRANVTTWDASPCLNATINDLDLSLFKHYFLPKAMSEADLEADNRDIKYQLSSFGFFDTRYDCPTNAGVLFFAKNLRRLVGGAYVQYVRFAGKDRAADITAEHEFKENLCTILPELDIFIKTGIAKRRPIPVSALREEMVADYPDWATRELLINAICHRDYTSNGPIQFYEYDDRIEIENHGGLYGRANEQNFPNVNDYRNMVVAEAMKVLGFANRQSRGVLRVQRDLVTNENGEAVFDFGFQTAVLVRVMKSLRGDRLSQSAIENGLLMAENEGKTPQMAENMAENEGKKPQMAENMAENERKVPFPLPIIRDVYSAIKQNRKIKYEQLQDNLGIGETTVRRCINWLKDNGYISKEHAKIKGEWQLLK